MLPTVLAQQDTGPIFESLRGGFSGPASSSVLIAILLVSLLVVVAVCAVFYVRWRWEARDNLNSPRELFDELCAAHDLSAEDKQFLIKLTRSAQLRRPDRVFIRPDVCDERANPCRPDGVQRLRILLFDA